MKAMNSPSLASLLVQSDTEPGARTELRRQARLALVPLGIVAALGGAWAATAPLSGAIVAPAQVKVELNRKTVQHQEGGIVREILVRDGQKVSAGEPLVVIGDVRSDAELSLLQGQLRAERIRQARAAAEAALAQQFSPPPGMIADPADEHLAREHALFGARRRTLDEQIASLQAQIRDAHAQAAALESQIAATETSTRLSDEELEINAKLAQQGYVARARVLALQRASADYRGKVGEYRSELAFVRQRTGDLESRIAQARNQYQSQAADELKEASAKARELEDRLRPSQDQVERQLVRSPVDGEVMALRVTAAGEAVGPRQPILDVVPAREKLVIEARIRPEDIDYVRKDAPAEVRLTAFDARTTPLLPGKVVFVSPDRVTKPESGESWFAATVEVDSGSLKDHPQLRLQAGMPAELFVTTPERTLLEYFAKPLRAFASRAMREP
ncbi:MAG TPA: HlyD family type I secretion periplasmic adaptor subunit [Burkholderiales bacterium]|jgi:HlyD family type I secretion membrane fusion protein|nr:HlyD family type I secretion periplasmic adaptor subunit [Burkholderiales bacterium]